MSANLPPETVTEPATAHREPDGLAPDPASTEVDSLQPEREDGDAELEARPRPVGRRVAPSRFGLILVAILAGGALFAGGYTLGNHVASTPGTPSAEEARFAGFWDVYSLIQSEYAGSPKPSQDLLVQGAIKGMLESLNDQWSYYQAPEDFASSLQNVGGQAQGIGVQVQLQPVDPKSTTACQAIGNGCELAVASVIDGSPAKAAGVLGGDVIATVDGVSLDGKTIDQATTLIRGTVGTTVKIGILRDGQSLTFSIVRAVFNRPEVAYKSLANGAVAYIAIAENINTPAASQFDAALSAAVAAGQKNVILDLRGNLGGYVDSAEKIASEFVSSGTLAYQEDAHGTVTPVDASAGGHATDSSIKLVVLVDGNTASAAEIIAGALQASDRGILIGSKTYGKGVVQEWLPLPNDMGGIHLTVARWLTPDKVWINGKGLQPDIPVDTSKARAGTDPVLDAALEHLGFPPQTTASPSPSAGSTASPSVSPSVSPSPNPCVQPSPEPTPTASHS
jgi:carboxyl-terminal processing protease